MGRVWECSWDYAEKRFIPTVEKYSHLKRKKEIDIAVSCELCLTTKTISDIRHALEKRSILMEKNTDIGIFTKLQPAHLIELPSPKQEPEKVDYILEKLKSEDIITVKRIQELKKEYTKKNLNSHIWSFPGSIKLIHGDFIEKVHDFPSESIDLILTDPPYGEEFLSLWDALGKFANRVLKPSGFLIAYAGQLHLAEFMGRLSPYLSYYWIFALLLASKDFVNGRNLYCKWKPILAFYKPPLIEPETFEDVLIGSGREKDLHEWQQSLGELKPLIEHFCPKNGLILDPLAGSGTTLLAAYQLERKVIGIEKDELTFKKMEERIGNATKPKKP